MHIGLLPGGKNFLADKAVKFAEDGFHIRTFESVAMILNLENVEEVKANVAKVGLIVGHGCSFKITERRGLWNSHRLR
jgi:hypothetical protein